MAENRTGPGGDTGSGGDASGPATGLPGSGSFSSRQMAFAGAAAIVGFAIAVYMTGLVGALGITMLAVGFGGLGPGLAYLMGNRSLDYPRAVAFRAALNLLMIAVIVLLLYKGVPIVK
jgi:hypothetical protein